MPVYLFTYHAYQSWMPDHRRGFVQKDRGVQPTNKPLADAYRRAAKAEALEFDPLTQYRLIAKARAVCSGDGYRLHGAATEPSHLHALVSWQDEAVPFTKVRGRIRNLLSLDLSKRAGTVGRPWFSTGASRKRVTDNGHFQYLLGVYLPRHGGVQWYEGRGWVNLPDGIEAEE